MVLWGQNFGDACTEVHLTGVSRVSALVSAGRCDPIPHRSATCCLLDQSTYIKVSYMCRSLQRLVVAVRILSIDEGDRVGRVLVYLLVKYFQALPAWQGLQHGVGWMHIKISTVGSTHISMRLKAER